MISETTFGPKQYLTLRKSIATSQITDKQMYYDAGVRLAKYIKQNNLTITGSWSVLYFLWDEQNHKAEIGIALPIAETPMINDSEFTLTAIPESKAAMAVLEGSYEKLGETHQLLMQYAKNNSLDFNNVPVIAVEEYAVSPKQDNNPENWRTNIYYLHN